MISEAHIFLHPSVKSDIMSSLKSLKNMRGDLIVWGALNLMLIQNYSSDKAYLSCTTASEPEVYRAKWYKSPSSK